MATEYGDSGIALPNEILRAEVGSGLHGLAVEGTDDHDEMGVFIEPPELVMGLGKPMNTYTWRTAGEGQRSYHGDTDLTLYSLRHYLKLATAGNPSILTILFAPESAVYTRTPLGDELRGLRKSFLSVQAVRRFIGYLDGQVERMKGGGKQNRVPNRPELIERYGYDTKYASHALRLAYQGLEILTDRTMTLPMPEAQRQHVRHMKTGGVPTLEEALHQIHEVRHELISRLDARETYLPWLPDIGCVSAWSVNAHLRHWQLEGLTHGR